MEQDPLRIARRLFGFESLRPGQEPAIRAILAHQDVLAVLPTGGGKSAIYQIAGTALRGPTVVVSPLIALQHDQAHKAEMPRAGGAAIVNSGVTPAVRREAFSELMQDQLEFIFLAPEQLGRKDVLERLEAARPSLFVVDEAHCISEWGHDFRPEYLRLAATVAALGHPPVLALTATAPPGIRQEIVERLGMAEPRVVLGDMDRPNIRLAVCARATPQAKLRALLDAVQDAEPPGIVYCSTRRHAEEVAESLADAGLDAAVYHAGMAGGERTAVQEEFMAGRLDVIVATTAFGMGVDKSDVRFVYHFDVPASLAAYYQEVGRAGRDGAAAEAILFYRPQDLSLHKFFAGGGQLRADELQAVLAAVRRTTGAEQELLREMTGLPVRKVAKAIAELEQQGAIEQAALGVYVARGGEVDIDRAVGAMQERQEGHRARLARDLERMRAYAELRDCRRRYLLEYFGQDAAPCERCDNCEHGVPEPDEDSAAPFPLKTRVAHAKLGKGIVLGYAGNRMTVLFDSAGEKALDVEFALTRGLLERL